MKTARRLFGFALPVGLAVSLLWLGRSASPSVTPPAHPSRTAKAPLASEAASQPARTVKLKLADGRVLELPVPDPGSVPPPPPFRTENPALARVADISAQMPSRLAALDEWFSAPLSDARLADTLAYLRSPVPAESAAGERERALRNTLLNRLREDPANAPRAVPAIAAQAADITQDAALRDYALQHLAAWAPRLSGEPKAQAIQSLKTALDDPRDTYAGTALLGLHDLARRGVLAADIDIGAQAERLAINENCSLLSRLSALSLAAELRRPSLELEALALRWADESSFLPLGARRAAEAYLKTVPSASL